MERVYEYDHGVKIRPARISNDDIDLWVMECVDRLANNPNQEFTCTQCGDTLITAWRRNEKIEVRISTPRRSEVWK